MNDTQVYQLDAPGRRSERVQVGNPGELRLGLVRLGLPDPKARAVAATIWGDPGGIYRGRGFSVEHLGAMTFIPVEPPIGSSTKSRPKSEAKKLVSKPRPVRPVSPTEPGTVSQAFQGVDAQAVDRMFADLEGDSRDPS